MDNKLTDKIKAYLEAQPEDRNVIEGATMLLQLNGNRILFNNVLRRPDKFADKVVYELKKYLRIRLDSMTVEDVARMDRAVIPAAKATIEAGAPQIDTEDDSPQEGTVAKGKRADHDELPVEIQKLWTDNADLYFKIKSLFEQLKTMEDAPSCDRYEYLVQLKEADVRYRENLRIYDSYKEGDALPTEDADGVAKKISAARKYISSNKGKLAELRESDTEKYATLLAKVQERIDLLKELGANIEQTQADELTELGLTV
jgi:hypothetical protein